MTKKYQATIPRLVREALGVQQGDLIGFEIENGVVTVRRVVPGDAEFALAVAETLGEWSSDHDEAAYRDL